MAQRDDGPWHTLARASPTFLKIHFRAPWGSTEPYVALHFVCLRVCCASSNNVSLPFPL